MDKEERELQIKLAQFNANIQIGIAWVFGSLGAALTLFVLAYQVNNLYSIVGISLWITCFVCILSASNWVRKVFRYSDKLENLQ